MKQIKTALVGLGRIGFQYHLPHLLEHPGFSLCAVVDIDPARRAEVNAHGYAELSEMLRAEQPELVVIASPTHLHEEHAISCLRAGADVFLDKPMAKDLASAERIAAVVHETGRKLMVYQPHRAFPEVAVLRGVLERGVLGELYMVKRCVSNYLRRNDWQAFYQYGGGMLNNYGAHYIDQLLYLTGAQVTRLRCHLEKIASLGDADDVVKLVLETDRGITLDLDINMACAYPMPQWMVLGTYGSAVYDASASVFRLKYYDPAKLAPLVASETLAAANRSYQSGEVIPWIEEEVPVTPELAVDFYEKCYAYFKRGESLFVPLPETLGVMRLIDRCHQDAKKDA